MFLLKPSHGKEVFHKDDLEQYLIGKYPSVMNKRIKRTLLPLTTVSSIKALIKAMEAEGR